MFNASDDYGMFYSWCSGCESSTHASDGHGCGCEEQEPQWKQDGAQRTHLADVAEWEDGAWIVLLSRKIHTARKDYRSPGGWLIVAKGSRYRRTVYRCIDDKTGKHEFIVQRSHNLTR
jgi:hypothetical protein